MKLKRMKLVALAMSALMITSALPVTAFAEEEVFFEEVADEALVGESEEEVYFEEDFEEEAVVGEVDDEDYNTADPVVLDESSIKFDLSGVGADTIDVTFVRKNADGTKTEDGTAKAQKGATVEATCTEGAYYRYSVTIDKKEFTSEKVYPNGSEGLGHNWVYVGKSIVVVDATCTETGWGYRVYKCSRCQEEMISDIPEDIDKIPHKWVDKTEYKDLDNIKTDANGNPVFGADGKAVLVNDQQNGKYTVVTYKECSVCHEKTEKTEKEVVVYAKEQLKEKVKDTFNIVDGDSYIGKKPEEMPKDEQAYILEDCTKDAYYIIGFYAENPDGKETCIAEEKVIIKAHHHIVKGIEFKDLHDWMLCDVKWEKGVPTVKNNSCYLDVTYKEVDHCDAPGCTLKKHKHATYSEFPNGVDPDDLKFISEGEKVAPHSGPHRINNEVKEQIASKTEWNYDDEKDKDGNVIEGLETIAKKEDSAINLKDLTATCTQPGTVTVEYKCKVCGEVIETQVVKVKARGHKRMVPVRENVVPSTCTVKGSYDAVVYCERCNEVLEKRTVALPLLPHTNEKYDDTKALIGFTGKVVVDDNSQIKKGDKITGPDGKFGVAAGEAGAYEDFFVSAEVYTLCDMCHGNKNVNDEAAFEIKVDDINKSEYSCLAGSITLTATYKRSDNSVVSTTNTFPYYTSVNAYQGRSQHDPETLADGTVRCKVCGTVITEGAGEQGGEEDKPKTPGESTIENLKDATCTEAGSYDLVTKAVEDGSVISTIHVVVPAKGHDYGTWVTSKKATVFATGKQKRTCSHCKNVETKSIAKLPSIITLNKTAVTVKVGKAATVKVSKWNLKDYIAPSSENGVVSANKNVATAFKTGSYTLKIRGKKAGSTTVKVKMKAGATAQIKVTVKK